MSTIKTGKQTHDDTVNKAEAVRQAVVVPTVTSKPTILSAEATFARAAVASAQANNSGSGLVPFMTYLRETGQSLYP